MGPQALNNSTFERQCKFSESLDKKEEEESMSDNHEYINSGLFNNQWSYLNLKLNVNANLHFQFMGADYDFLKGSTSHPTKHTLV